MEDLRFCCVFAIVCEFAHAIITNLNLISDEKT